MQSGHITPRLPNSERFFLFGEVLSVKEDISAAFQYINPYVLILTNAACLTSYDFDRGHPVVWRQICIMYLYTVSAQQYISTVI